MNSDHNRRRHDKPRGKDGSQKKQEDRTLSQGEKESKPETEDKKKVHKKRTSKKDRS